MWTSRSSSQALECEKNGPQLLRSGVAICRQLDPMGFWSWSLRLKQDQFAFRRWLDTRSIPFPGETDRTGDTVAWIDDPSKNLTPWAVAAEFQLEPDPLMCGCLL